MTQQPSGGQSGGPWTTGPNPASMPPTPPPTPIGPPVGADSDATRTLPPFPGPLGPGRAAGPPIGPPPGPMRQPWPTSPQHAAQPAPAPLGAGRGRWSTRLIAGVAAGAAVVLIGASVGITLALDQHGSGTTTAAAGSAPRAGTGTGSGTGSAPAQVGETSAAALVSSYVKAENAGQGDAMLRLLCGGSGPAADSAQEWSWTFIALHEQVDPSPLAPAAAGQQVTFTVSYRGQTSGQYGALLAQHGNRWCVQAIANGPLVGAGQ